MIPPCTEEENRELLKRVKAGEREAKNRLVEGNLKKALFFIQDYLNRGVPMADLIQEASMELMELADEGFQEGFEKLLESRIHVRMEEVIREQKAEMDLEEEMLARVNVLQEVSKRMAEELGREASLKELAERMKMTEEDVREIMKMTMDALKPVSYTHLGLRERDRPGKPGVSGRRSRDRKIHPLAPGLPESVHGRKKGPLYFRGGVLKADQDAGQPDRYDHRGASVPL